MRPLTVVLLLAAAPAQEPSPSLTWLRDFAAAQAAQKADGRPVLAYFTFET